MRMCLNRKVIIGVAVVALGVLVVDPHLFSRILPLLFFAICPLSMVFMMWGMRKTGVMQRMSGNGQRCGMSSGDMDMGQTGVDMGQPGVASIGRATEDEVVRLRAEVDQLRAERAATT